MGDYLLSETGGVAFTEMGQLLSTATANDDWHGLSSQASEALENKTTEFGWQQHDIPEALSTYPEHINISDELQNILTWSLLRYEPKIVAPKRSYSPDLPEVVPAEPQQSTSTAGPVSDDGQTDPATTDTRIDLRIKNDGSEESGHSAEHSGRMKPLFTKLKRLRQDVATKIASRSQYQTVPPLQQDPVEPQTRECISCFDEFPEDQTVSLECSHDYCKECAAEVIRNAMKNEAAFPPKCCLTEIPLQTVLLCLDKFEREAYQDKSAEYAIPAGHRWYCPEPQCAKWIRPEKLHRQRRSHQTCPHCRTKMCSICRAVAHDTNADCPQDFGLESTLEVAESEGWRRCYSCRTMVELTVGCRHITCRCGAEFCYVCSARWRTCSCTEDDKQRRIEEARRRREDRERREREDAQRQQEEIEAANAAEAEAQEIAEAIRQVEEFEREEAIREAEREAVRQLEEELALARLEEQRLLEEIERRQKEEEAQARFRAVLMESSRTEGEINAQILDQVIDFQRAALISSHDEQYYALERGGECHQQSALQSLHQHELWLQENIDFRRSKITDQHATELKGLHAKFEEEEDELFMQMHMYFKDKPNREQREKNMRTTLQRQQKQKQDELEAEQKQALDKFQYVVGYEQEAMRRAVECKTAEAQQQRKQGLMRLGRVIGCDRKVFELVTRRRLALMAEHTKATLAQIEVDEFATGLSEEQARDIRPILPALNGLHWQAGLAMEQIRSTDPNEAEDLYGSSSVGRSQHAGSRARSVRSSGYVSGGQDTLQLPGSFPQEHNVAAFPDSNRVSVARDLLSDSNRVSTLGTDEGLSSEPVSHIGSPTTMTMYNGFNTVSSGPSAVPQETTAVRSSDSRPAAREDDEILPAPLFQHSSRQSRVVSASNDVMPNVGASKAPAHFSVSSASTVNTFDSVDSNGRRVSSRTSMSMDPKRDSIDRGKKGFFSRTFGKKELSEEEIRRRMISAAGDGFGG